MAARNVHLSSDALFQEIGGEGVILDLASSTYFGLDEVGVRFWQLVQGNPDIQAACETLLDEFDVAADQLAVDIDHLVGQLVDSGLARVA